MIKFESHSAIALQCFLAALCVGIALATGFSIFMQQMSTWKYPQQSEVVYIAFGGGAFGVLCCCCVGCFLLVKTGSCCVSIRRSYDAIPVVIV